MVRNMDEYMFDFPSGIIFLAPMSTSTQFDHNTPGQQIISPLLDAPASSLKQ